MTGGTGPPTLRWCRDSSWGRGARRGMHPGGRDGAAGIRALVRQPDEGRAERELRLRVGADPGPLGGVQLAPTNQVSCTYRHGGYLYSNRPTFIAPGSGRITAIRVRSGPNPAKLRLTILTGSSRVDTFSGRDLPGTYTCCTARFVGRAFRPRPNALTTKRVNVKVVDVRDKRLRFRIHSSDGVALTAVGPGTVPLQIRDDVGAFNPGIPMAIGYWPFTGWGSRAPRTATR